MNSTKHSHCYDHLRTVWRSTNCIPRSNNLKYGGPRCVHLTPTSSLWVCLFENKPWDDGKFGLWFSKRSMLPVLGLSMPQTSVKSTMTSSHCLSNTFAECKQILSSASGTLLYSLNSASGFQYLRFVLLSYFPIPTHLPCDHWNTISSVTIGHPTSILRVWSASQLSHNLCDGDQ